MMKLIDKPNLPEDKVTTLICGTDDEAILFYFAEKRITVIKNAPNLNIDTAVSTHAYMAAVHLGGENILICKAQTKLKKSLESFGVNVIESENEVEGDYPNDIGLNFAFVGSYIFGNFSYADKILLKATERLERVNVKQGYCKCSVLVLSENAIITDDEGIYRKASEKGIDALLVSKGDIALDGHPYGFIGGASGKISNDRILFFGDVEKHRNFSEISSFLSKHGCSYECTDKGALRDIGGIVSVCEE